jgi:hypothetical protein
MAVAACSVVARVWSGVQAVRANKRIVNGMMLLNFSFFLLFQIFDSDLSFFPSALVSGRNRPNRLLNPQVLYPHHSVAVQTLWCLTGVLL